MNNIKQIVRKLPLIGPFVIKLSRLFKGTLGFSGSQKYWEQRYAEGGNSGGGSFGNLAKFKAETLNSFVKERDIKSVIEFGCGDGNQLSLADYPKYIGLDVSETAIQLSKKRFENDKTKEFFVYVPENFAAGTGEFQMDMSMSLDVVYHLVEDSIFEQHMRHLFACSKRYVIVYSTDYGSEEQNDAHVKHRCFSQWVKTNRPEWQLIQRIANTHPFSGDYSVGSDAEFFIYERQ